MKEQHNHGAVKKPLAKRFKPRPGIYNIGVRKPTPKKGAKGRFAINMLTNADDKEADQIEFLNFEELTQKGLSAIATKVNPSGQPKIVFAIDGNVSSSS